jgi:hypothetical protein
MAALPKLRQARKPTPSGVLQGQDRRLPQHRRLLPTPSGVLQGQDLRLPQHRRLLPKASEVLQALDR